MSLNTIVIIVNNLLIKYQINPNKLVLSGASGMKISKKKFVKRFHSLFLPVFRP